MRRLRPVKDPKAIKALMLTVGGARRYMRSDWRAREFFRGFMRDGASSIKGYGDPEADVFCKAYWRKHPVRTSKKRASR